MIAIDVCLSDLPKEKITTANNGKRYIKLMLSERREVGKFGETHSLAVSKTKDEREMKMPTIYVGGGKEYVPKQSFASTPPVPARENFSHDNLPWE